MKSKNNILDDFLFIILFIIGLSVFYENTKELSVKINKKESFQEEKQVNNSDLSQLTPFEIVYEPNIIDEKELLCLKKNIFFEARGEDYKEKMRIAKVTLNRVNSSGFPNNVCDVVYQVLEDAAFSWTVEKHDLKELLKNKIEYKAWLDSVEIANLSLQGYLPKLDISDDALMFHANYIKKPKSWTYAYFEFKSPYHTYYKIIKK